MNKIKKYIWYVFLFMLMYIIVTVLTNFGMKTTYKDIKCNISAEEFQIKIEDAKSTKSTGYINGTVTNNSGELIDKIYLRIELYEKDKHYLTTKYKEIKYFNVGETTRFEIDFDNNVKEANVTMVKELPKGVETGDNIGNKILNSLNIETTEDTMKVAIPIAAVLGLMCILP